MRVEMTGVVVFFFYGSVLFCFIAFLARIAGFVRTPLHLKWEYYSNGSVYEFVDWWTRTPVGFLVKLKSLLIDILFLRKYYRYNRKYWLFLYLFHLGVYFIVLWHIWLFTTSLTGGGEGNSAVGLIWGHGATALATSGGLGVLILRITNEDLRLYCSPVQYAKWVMILVTLAGGFYAVHVYFDDSMGATLKYVTAQVAFRDMTHKLHPPAATAAHVIFGSIWLVFLPFSHIAQLIFRYYHTLRFDEVPNVRGNMIERKVKALLMEPVSWSASHIQSGKTWGEVATCSSGKASNQGDDRVL